MGKIFWLIIGIAVFVLFIYNTDFQGMSFRDIRIVLTVYGVCAGIIGSVIAVRTGFNILANTFIGMAVLAILASFLAGLF